MSGGKTIPQLPYEPTFRFDATEGYGINCLSGTYPDCTNIACHLCCNQRPDSYSTCPACYSSFRNIGNTTQTWCAGCPIQGTTTSSNNHRLWTYCGVNPTIECQFSNAYGGMYQAWNSYRDFANTHQNCCNPNLIYIHGGAWCFGLPRYSLVLGFQLQEYKSCETTPTVVYVPNINYSGHYVRGCCCWTTGCIVPYPIVVNGSIPGVEFKTGCRYIVGIRYEPDNCCVLCNYARYCGLPHACCNSGYYISMIRDDGQSGYHYHEYAEHCPYQCATSSTTNDCMASIGIAGTYGCNYTSSQNLWMNVGNFAYWENCALSIPELHAAMDAYKPKYNITTSHEFSENPIPFTWVRWEGTNTTSGTACQSNSIYEFYIFCNGMAELRTGVWTCDNGQFGQYNSSGTGTNFGAITPQTSYVWCAFCPSTTLYTGYTYLNGQIIKENRAPVGGNCAHWFPNQGPFVGQRTHRPVPSTCYLDSCIEGTAYTSAILTSSTDDAFVCAYMPHTYCALGTTYSAGTYMYVSTNGIISFGSGSSAYSGLTSTSPAINKIYIDAADRSAQYIVYHSSKK